MGRRRFLSFLVGDRFVGNGIFTDAHRAFVALSGRHLCVPVWCAEGRWALVEGRLRGNARSSVWREFGSQAREGMWGMPGHTEARKAVVSCEKLGGVAHTR
jgi:hypothetical protein